PDQAVQ
ncbi:hypothetical protein EC82524_4048B, partial [Escherichia coli 8.2524]